MTRDDDTLMRGADVQSPAERKQRERWRKNNNILPSGPVDLEPRTRDLYLRIGLLPVGKASDKKALAAATSRFANAVASAILTCLDEDKAL